MLAQQIETLFFKEPDNVELAQDTGVSAVHKGYDDLGELLIAAQTPQDIADALCFNWPATKVAVQASLDLGWYNSSEPVGTRRAVRKSERKLPPPVYGTRAVLPAPGDRRAFQAFSVSFSFHNFENIDTEALSRAWRDAIDDQDATLPFWSVDVQRYFTADWQFLLRAGALPHEDPSWDDIIADDLWARGKSVGAIILEIAPYVSGFLGRVHELIGSWGDND